jgi:hypothetical protein
MGEKALLAGEGRAGDQAGSQARGCGCNLPLSLRPLHRLRLQAPLEKDPNSYINDSQRGRAESFFNTLRREFGGIELGEVMRDRKPRRYGDPLEDIPHARDKDFGSYNRRRK